jgi:hypothetical protein
VVLLYSSLFCCEGTKTQSLVFCGYFPNLAKAQGRKVSFWNRFLFSNHSFSSIFSSGNACPSPDRSGNPFYGGVRHKKIGADSGK